MDDQKQQQLYEPTKQNLSGTTNAKIQGSFQEFIKKTWLFKQFQVLINTPQMQRK